MAKFKKYQGESLAFTKGLTIDGVEQSFAVGWTCKLQVKSTLGGAALIDKTITETNADDSRFVGRITPTEMGTLVVGGYFLVMELVNAGELFNQEIHDELIVSEQGIL